LKKKKLKKHIFDSAFNIVEKEGINNLSIRKIALRSNCSLGSIYNVYDNFQILQLHINEKVLANLFDKLLLLTKNGIKRGASFRSILKDLGEAYIEYGQNNKELWKSLFEYFVEEKIPSWYAISARKGVYKICELLSKAFNIPEKNIKHMVGFFWSSIHGMCSILLNRKMEMVSELLESDSTSSYIEYCLDGLPLVVGREISKNFI